MSNLDKPAMPQMDAFVDANGERPVYTTEEGITIRQHASLTLRVPMSGDPELDAMIREARRLDMATAALQALIAATENGDLSHIHGATDAIRYADALLAASDSKKAEPIGCHVCAHAKVESVDVCNSCFKDGKLTRFERRHHHKASKGKACSENISSLGTTDNSEPQPDAEGWIEWRGVGDCPIYGATIVECKLRDGSTYRDLAMEWRWDHYGSGGDIIAYRVVKEAQA